MRLSEANPYTHPEIAIYLDSCELPLQVSGGVTPITRGETWLQHFAWLLPGVGLAVAVAGLGYLTALGMARSSGGGRTSPISPILLANVFGLLLGNLTHLPRDYEAGLKFCGRVVLRVGIVLLGLRLSLSALGVIGWSVLPLVVTCIASGLLIVTVVGRWLGLPPRLAALIGVGTGICGISAITATAPAIQAEDDEVSYAVGCITLFGVISFLVYPWLSYKLFAGDASAAGMFLGTAVHDTAQVTGAAMAYSQRYDAPVVLEVATVTKLLRNLFIVAAVPLLAWWARPQNHTMSMRRYGAVVPPFIVLFVVMVGIRTLGDFGEAAFGMLPREAWEQLLSWSRSATVGCLMLAMASVGLVTRLSRLHRLGIKPLGLGFVAAVAVGLISYVLIQSEILPS